MQVEANEWIKEENDTFTIGITQAACQSIGEIVYVELPKVGARFEKEEVVCVLESTKAAVDIYMPQAGEVVSVNTTLYEHPEYINQDPREKGWLVCFRKIT